MSESYVKPSDEIVSHHYIRRGARTLERALERDDLGNQYAVRRGQRRFNYYVVRLGKR